MIKTVTSLVGMCGLLALVAAPTLAQDKMGDKDKMGGKMSGGKMTGSKMSHGKMSHGKMGSKMSTKHRRRRTHHKMSGTMSHGKMGDKMSGGKRMGGKMSTDKKKDKM